MSLPRLADTLVLVVGRSPQLLATWPCVEVQNTGVKSKCATLRIGGSVWSISLEGASGTTLGISKGS